MDEKFMLVMGEGENQIRYMIAQIIRVDGKNFFSIFNMTNADMLFGEFLGELPEDEDQARELIWQDFQDGCKRITYPDGHIMDDLFCMLEMF